MLDDVEQGHQNQRHVMSSRPDLITNELGINWARLDSLDLFWREKLWALFDALQIFALLWSLSQPWSWPRPWLAGTRWSVAINLDVVSVHDAAMTVTGPGTRSSLWGELQGYVRYALALSLVPVGLGMLWHFREKLVVWWLDRSPVLCRRDRIVLGKENNPHQKRLQLLVSNLIALERVLLLAAHLLYLPVVLAVIRLVLCDDDGTLSVDPGTSCRSASLMLQAVFGIAVVVAFTLYLHERTTRAANAVTVYRHRADHERFLQQVEIEYALSLCSTWATDHLWMVSSFRLHAVCYRVFVMYLKLALVLVYAFGRPYLAYQAVAFWGVLTLWSIWTSARPPYRCRSSNRLHMVLYTTLWTNSLFGMMTGYGFRIPLVVAWTQYRSLVAMNFVGAAIAVGVVFAALIDGCFERHQHRKIRSPRADDSPVPTDVMMITGAQADDARLLTDDSREHPEAGDSTPHRAVDKSHPAVIVTALPKRWPIRATLHCLAQFPRRREWVDAMRRAKDLRFQCEMSPRGFEPIRALEEHMRSVRHLWADAKAQDSTLEAALGSSLERLALVHARVSSFAPYRGLTAALEDTLLDPEVQAAMARRRQAQALMTERQRRVMLKLLAIAAFLNHRDLRNVSSVTSVVRRLKDDTARVWSQPKTSQTRARNLKLVCTKWKRFIQRTERDFETVHGYPPNQSDKALNSEWYEQYKKLRASLDALQLTTTPTSARTINSSSSSAAADSKTSPRQRGGSVIGLFTQDNNHHDDGPHNYSSTPSPGANRRVSILIRATEQVLSTAGNRREEGGDDDTGLLEAEACRKQWKRVIRDWEADFEERNGTAPEAPDKQVVRGYYEQYGRLRTLVSTVSKFKHF